MTSSSLPEPVVREPLTWARDFTIVGLITGFAAPFAFTGFLAFSAVAGLVGGVVGGLLGASLGTGLEALRRWRTPLSLLLLMGPGLGALWGGLAGGIAGWLTDPLGMSLSTGFGVLMGGAAGALQFSWFWFAYLVLHTRRQATWPLVVVASTLGILLGGTYPILFEGAGWLMSPYAAIGASFVGLAGCVALERAVHRARLAARSDPALPQREMTPR